MDLIKHTDKLWERKGERGSYWLVWCPACNCGHSYPVGTGVGSQWSFNGNLQAPSFAPSMRLMSLKPEVIGKTFPSDELAKHKPEHWDTRCHFTITDGIIQYHGDNPHALNGQKVPMQPFPPDYGF